jgi:hypothetical protein
MLFSRLGFRKSTGQSQIQKSKRSTIVISESDGRTKDSEAAESRNPEKEATKKKKFPCTFPLLKLRPKGRCKA